VDKILNIIRTVAPSIATALGGPLAGMAVTAVSNAVLGRPDGSEDEIAAAMQSATPEQLLALKKAEQEFLIHMRELDIDLERIAGDDRNSARNREIKTRDWAPKVLAGLVTTGYFGVLFWMLRYGLPANGASEALLVMLGALGSAWGGVITYYFGSSAGSRAKDGIIQRMQK
jgi:hypothetical protein